MRKRITGLLCAGVALLCHGHETPESSPAEICPDSLRYSLMLEEVTVTGTRTPKTLKDTPIQMRLITESDIKGTDSANLQELLQQEMPGVEFSYAMNQQVNMNVSGFSGQSVLVLVDGERLAGETMDNVDFDRLLSGGISRVEIVKGASSALYGSNAAGGVINLITKEASRPWQLTLNARAADHHEWRYGGELLLHKNRVSNVLNVDHSRVSSYDVCLDQSDDCDFRRVPGQRMWNVRDKLTWQPMAGLKLTARAGYFFKERLYNIDTPDRYRDFSGGVRGVWDIDPTQSLELSYSYDQYDKSDYIKDHRLDVRDYSNVQNSVRGLYTKHWDGFSLTGGADVMRDYLSSYQFADGKAKTQTTGDLFVQGDLPLGDHWELIGAVRWDYFSDGDMSQVTGKLNARYRLGDLTLRGGYAGGFRAPTLKEKYMNFDMAGIFDIHGNAGLSPEKSHNLNLSAEYTWQNYYFTLGGHYDFVDNKISTSGILYDAEGPYINYINVKDLRTYGLEATVRGRWTCGAGASVSYAYVHEETRGGAVTQYCPARPHSLTARVNWRHDWSRRYSTDIALSGRMLSKVKYKSMYMYEPFEEKEVVNPTYTLWKLRLSQTLDERYTLTLAVDNLFNYGPAVYSYNAPVTLGASLMVGLEIRLYK